MERRCSKHLNKENKKEAMIYYLWKVKGKKTEVCVREIPRALKCGETNGRERLQNF